MEGSAGARASRSQGSQSSPWPPVGRAVFLDSGEEARQLKGIVVERAVGLAGRIILLNGASSAGKSTLSRALQRALEEPFLHVASDNLALGLPERRDAEGPFLWWGNLRPRFFDGFHRCLAALAAAGNDLIVEHIIEFPEWRADLRQLLQPFDVFLVGVHCSLDEIDRRERLRGDRRIGEGREHVEVDRIHDFGPYDFEVETTGRSAEAVAVEVLRGWHERTVSVLRVEPSPPAGAAR